MKCITALSNRVVSMKIPTRSSNSGSRKVNDPPNQSDHNKTDSTSNFKVSKGRNFHSFTFIRITMAENNL